MLFQADRWLDIHHISISPINSHHYYLCCPKSYKSIKRFQVKIVPSNSPICLVVNIRKIRSTRQVRIGVSSSLIYYNHVQFYGTRVLVRSFPVGKISSHRAILMAGVVCWFGLTQAIGTNETNFEH